MSVGGVDHALGLTFMPPADGFLGLDGDTAPRDARAVIIPFGLEATVSYGGGTAAGPAAIIAASHEVETFDDVLWCEAVERYGVATLVEPDIASPVAAALDQLAGLVDAVLQRGRFPLVLGGEHSITAGAIRPFVARHPSLAVLHFDAHADLRDGYAGEHYSHAAALRRVLDHPQVDTLVSVGIRNISRGEIPFLEAQRDRIHIHWGRDKRRYDVEQIVAPLVGRAIYVTFDVDGFDASLMPSTGTPEPGGLFWDDVMPIIAAAARVGRIVGADVNELAPIAGLRGPDFVAAKLVYRILNEALIGGRASAGA